MINFYAVAVRELQNFSQSLSKTSILINKPWALIDEDQEIQKLIFKKNKELVISKNGNVSLGTWDYLPEAKSLLINRTYDSILCNECFIDDGVLILKKDGTGNEFFVLANENIVTDLDPINYLRNLRNRELKISYGYLQDGRIIEIYRYRSHKIEIGDDVKIEYGFAEDGTYITTKLDKKYIVRNKKIAKIVHLVKYTTNGGKEIVVEQKLQNRIQNGDLVLTNDEPARDGKYKILDQSDINVKDGKVANKFWF